MSYFICMIDYGRSREAVVDPEMTRRNVIERIASGEYENVLWVHEILTDGTWADLTEEVLAEAEQMSGPPVVPFHDRQEAAWDHARKLRAEAV